MTETMIGPRYVRAMAAYNAEMNRRLYTAAAGLSDEERRRERGAFWGSIHGTLCHLAWADQNWMCRFDGWDVPPVGQKQSASFIAEFGALQQWRTRSDERFMAWAKSLDKAWLAQDLVWFSGTVQREVRAPRDFLLVHLFNHQTHHRGQVHAMITAAGASVGDTDLVMIVSPAAI